MKFDTIIIGGGLSGYTAGITLAKKGQKCLLISAGQSALHFFNGSFELLNGENPIDAIASLDEIHPYAKIGSQRVAELADMVKPMFAEMGVETYGDAKKNHYRITPVGLLKQAWLTLDELAAVPAEGDKMPWKNAQVITIKGFLDFSPVFVASNLAKRGMVASLAEVTTPELEKLRSNQSEMRATNIAKTLTGDALAAFAEAVNGAVDAKAEVVLLPAVFGVNDAEACKAIQKAVKKPVKLIATMPPSVPGLRIQTVMRRKFMQLGGTLMQSDAVVRGHFENGKLVGVFTENHGEREFLADNFIIATGNFITHGLASTRDGVFEPALGLDIHCPVERKEWTASDIFADQPFMSFGVATDATLHAVKDGKPVANLYATGNVLGGFNAVKQGCTTGISLITGLYAAHQIIK